MRIQSAVIRAIRVIRGLFCRKLNDSEGKPGEKAKGTNNAQYSIEHSRSADLLPFAFLKLD